MNCNGTMTCYDILPIALSMFAVCKTDSACAGFPLAGMPDTDGDEISNMTCYKGGETVFQNHQICSVTSTPCDAVCFVSLSLSIADRKILDMLPDRPPEVTFSCNKADGTCQFEFWTAQVESFYCALNACTVDFDHGFDSNTTKYACENIQCKCVPGRFICGEDGSVGAS